MNKKSILVMVVVASVSSLLIAMEGRSSLQKMTAKAIVAGLQAGRITPNAILQLPKLLRDGVVRQYYLTVGSNINNRFLEGISKDRKIVEEYLRNTYRFSIQELLDHGRLPRAEGGILYLKDKYIAFLDGLQNIPNIAQVKELYLSHNKLSDIKPDAFRGFAKLGELDLENNQLSDIKPDAFRGLARLEELYLSHNQLSDIKPDAFRGLANLKLLDLDYNKLNDIKSDAFRGLANLVRLDLQNNKLREKNIKEIKKGFDPDLSIYWEPQRRDVPEEEELD